MFLGQYRHTIDTKGRLIIPARFRERISNGAVITQGFDKNLMVMTQEYFMQVYEDLRVMNLTDPVARLLRRLILGNAFPVDVDKAGRILLPQPLRASLELKDEAVVVGQGEYFEIWLPQLWEEQLALLQDAEANAHRFAALNVSATVPEADHTSNAQP